MHTDYILKNVVTFKRSTYSSHQPYQVVQSLHPSSFQQTQRLLIAAEPQVTVSRGCEINLRLSQSLGQSLTKDLIFCDYI